MSPTIKELYEECVNNDFSYMAHALYYLLREGFVSPDDPQTAIDCKRIDHQEVEELMRQNYLCLQVIKPFSLKIAEDEFVFVFALNAGQAMDLIREKWCIKHINCHEYHLDFSMMRGKEFVTFREMKKDFPTFPAIIGVYKREAVYK